MAGRQIYADINGNGLFDPPVNGSGGEPSTLTAADGSYQLEFDAVGSVTLRQQLPAGWFATSPADAHEVLVSFATEPVRDFGSRQFAPGDLNGDGVVNNQDIAPFVLALTSPTDYEAQHPSVPLLTVADLNGDGVVNNQDIAPFVALLTGGRPVAARSVAVEDSTTLAKTRLSRNPWTNPFSARPVIRRDVGILSGLDDRIERANDAEPTAARTPLP